MMGEACGTLELSYCQCRRLDSIPPKIYSQKCSKGGLRPRAPRCACSVADRTTCCALKSPGTDAACVVTPSPPPPQLKSPSPPPSPPSSPTPPAPGSQCISVTPGEWAHLLLKSIPLSAVRCGRVQCSAVLSRHFMFLLSCHGERRHVCCCV